MKEPQALKQIHKIREKIYKKTKNMSDKDFLVYIRKSSNVSLKNFLEKLKKKRRKAG